MSNSTVQTIPGNGTSIGTITDAGDFALPELHTEQWAFESVTWGIENADTSPKRIRALGHNHDLWSTLVKDLVQDGNRLPPAVKNELIGLGMWSMRYSTLAILHDLPLQPLIAVNLNIADGLAQQHAAA